MPQPRGTTPANWAIAQQASLEARRVERDKRRKDVENLLAMGFNQRQIADQMHLDVATVRRYVAEINESLQLEAVPDLATRIRRSVEQRQHVIREAWMLYHKLSPEKQNKVTALQTVLSAQDAIDRLEGTASPDATNAAAMAELYRVLMHVARETGGQQMVAAILKRLQLVTGGSSRGVVLGAIDAPQQEEVAETVEGSIEDEDDEGGDDLTEEADEGGTDDDAAGAAGGHDA